MLRTSIRVVLVVMTIFAAALIYREISKIQSFTPQTDPQQYSWQFSDAGTDPATTAPMTAVQLLVNDQQLNLGIYQGNCSTIASSSWRLLKNEKTGVICWWAGGGKELGIFNENGKDVLKLGELNEGFEEMPGLRGNFIPLPFPLSN